jgi:8-oxo-dGTP diphosphatase
MEQGELPKECAIRECKEESNQTISNLKFIGVAKYPNLNAAIYYTFLNENEEKPFVENDEISECRWWKLGEEIVDLDVESMKLIELYNDSN